MIKSAYNYFSNSTNLESPKIGDILIPNMPQIALFLNKNLRGLIKGVGRKFSGGGGGPTEKKPKIGKKYQKIALFSLFQEGGEQKRPKNSKKMAKNSTFKPLSTILVPCMKFQRGGGTAPFCPPLPTPMGLRIWSVLGQAHKHSLAFGSYWTPPPDPSVSPPYYEFLTV